MSDEVMSVQQMIDAAFGDPECNTVNFRMLQTVLLILANQLRILDRHVQVNINYKLADSASNLSITQLKIHAVEKKNKKKAPRSALKSAKDPPSAASIPDGEVLRRSSKYLDAEERRERELRIINQFVAILSLAVAAAAIPLVPVAKVAYEHEAPAHYEFQYSVEDHHTGDVKQQQESRNGDAVHGSYSLVQPDGVRRIVEYTSDKEHGFNAIVRYEGHPIEAPKVAKIAYAAPVAKIAYAAPVAKIAYAAPVTKVAYAAPVAKLAYAAPVAKVAYAAAPAHVTFSSPAVSYHH